MMNVSLHQPIVELVYWHDTTPAEKGMEDAAEALKGPSCSHIKLAVFAFQGLRYVQEAMRHVSIK